MKIIYQSPEYTVVAFKQVSAIVLILTREADNAEITLSGAKANAYLTSLYKQISTSSIDELLDTSFSGPAHQLTSEEALRPLLALVQHAIRMPGFDGYPDGICFTQPAGLRTSLEQHLTLKDIGGVRYSCRLLNEGTSGAPAIYSDMRAFIGIRVATEMMRSWIQLAQSPTSKDTLSRWPAPFEVPTPLEA
ncbi:MAG: hypothetical protein Q7S87_08670 [Agitococcus sp.]|nr:hypothetical protein [Agitococcus sp.]MDO9177643.1 hypothetical protein [Agitococcus sp.]